MGQRRRENVRMKRDHKEREVKKHEEREREREKRREIRQVFRLLSHTAI